MKKAHLSFQFVLSTLFTVFTIHQGVGLGQDCNVDLSKGTGKVEFHAVGRPSMLKIHGVGGAPQGCFSLKNGKISGNAAFDLESLDTGIALRNRHMKEKYLETSKFRMAKFELDPHQIPARMPSSKEFKMENVDFKGKLTVHGVTKTVVGKAALTRNQKSVDVQLQFPGRMVDHNIEIPSFAGVTVAKDVDVVVSFSAPIQAR